MIGCGVIFAALTFSASWRSLAFARILGGNSCRVARALSSCWRLERLERLERRARLGFLDASSVR